MSRAPVSTLFRVIAAIMAAGLLCAPLGAQAAAARTDRVQTEAFTITQRSDKYRVHISYPSIGNTVADTELAIWATGQSTLFIRGIEDLPTAFPYELTISYSLQNASPRVASVIFTISTYTGGAHPEPGMATFVYDLSNGRLLSYADIFRDTKGLLPFLSSYCRAELTKKLGDGPEGSMIKAGTEEDMVNFDLFSLNAGGLVVHFPPYQVAPYASGYQEVHIPLEKLTPFAPLLPLWGKAPGSS